MLSGEVFTIQLPTLKTQPGDNTSDIFQDTQNSNYYTDYNNRGTNCCNCDK